MNAQVQTKISKMLTDTRGAPMMYAMCVESMLQRVATLLEVAGVQFSVTEFYGKHGGVEGNCLLLRVPSGMSFDDWSKTVIDDALGMLNVL